MDLDQMVDRALAQAVSQYWPFLLLILALAVLKGLLRGKRSTKRTRNRSARARAVPKTDEEKDYDRRLAGVAGELKVRTFIERRYANSIHDTYLPSKRGVTQIDHIVLVAGAIVVIETKNYGGLILGDEKAQKWTQVMGRGTARISFMNPIHQNVGHVSAVKMALGADAAVSVENLVVFVGDAKFGRPLPGNVIALSDLGCKLEQIAREHPAAAHAKDVWPTLCSHCLAKPRPVLEAEHRETLSRRSGYRQSKAI